MQDTMKGTRSYGSVAGGLGLPMQAAPIDRTLTGVTLTSSAGVEASFPFLALAPLAISAISKLF